MNEAIARHLALSVPSIIETAEESSGCVSASIMFGVWTAIQPEGWWGSKRPSSRKPEFYICGKFMIVAAK